jgi:exopolyphosphatase / guanosine-5'-triphosphate,3'-diphosphate pyrophosphatase
MPMLLSAIDIGTNAVRLFFSYVFNQNGQIFVEKASLVRIPIRLGEDVFSLGYISEEKIRNLSKTMQAFKLLIDVYQPVAYKVCATAAMREALNNEYVVERIARETGLQIEIIDGLMEAGLVSAFTDKHFAGAKKYNLFIDVGGGSTELSLLKGQELVLSSSFKIGTVRLLKDQVDQMEWNALKKWLKQHRDKKKDLLLVGSGGNINKITKIYGKLPDNMLSFEQLEFGLNDLSAYTLDQRIQLLGLRPDRADVIIPAGQIFHFIMKQLKSEVIYVPKIGLSDGMVTLMYKEQIANH